MYLHPSDGWAFSNDIKNSDWSRYGVYARRIREVTIRDDVPEKRVSVQAMRTMLAQLPSHLQLPLPSSIDLRTTPSAPTTLLELPLISQSLQKLIIVQVLFQDELASQSFVAYLQGLIQAASRLHDPCLEELAVYCSTSSAALSKAFDACLIKHKNHIARLTAKFPFDGQVWASIFSLPALQTLDIAPPNDSTSTPDTSVDLITMVQTLVESQPLLKELRLERLFALHGDSSNSAYSRIIRLLMGLRNLEILILRISLPFNLSESEVRAMGASWPKMRILTLSTICFEMGYMHRGEPGTELSLLPFFIQFLPRLEDLHVSFVCNTALEAPQELLPVSALHTFDLDKCPKPVASQKEVTEYLAAVLPRHTRLHHWSDFDDSGHFWDGVADDLDTIWNATQ